MKLRTQQILQYNPTGHRDIGRPRRRREDDLLNETHRDNLLEVVVDDDDDDGDDDVRLYVDTT
jgi:hypothetical protein